jgi:hypothetical protein
MQGAVVVFYWTGHGRPWQTSGDIPADKVEIGLVCSDSGEDVEHTDLYMYVVYRWLHALFTKKKISQAVRPLLPSS